MRHTLSPGQMELVQCTIPVTAVWAKACRITGDRKYLDFMFSEYKTTTQYFFDTEERLYFRDDNSFGKLDKDTKTFWSRGNGWVFAGLTDIVSKLDKKNEEYKFFLEIYKRWPGD